MNTSNHSRMQNSGLKSVLRNDSGQYAIWPDGLPPPAGWRSVSGPASPARCRDEVRARWADSLPSADGVQGGGGPARTLQELLRSTAARRAAATAVVAEDGEITYNELEARSNRLAVLLAGLGVDRATVVPVCVERGIDMVVALLAVLKTGAAFLPLDPAHPDRRLRRLVEDADGRFVLTTADHAWRFRTCGVTPVLADARPADGERRSGLERRLADRAVTGPDRRSGADRCGPAFRAAPVRDISPDDVAYLMYTSGTTGAPKGVLVGNRELTLSLTRTAEAYGLTEDDRVLQLAALGFDTSVEQIFTPLISGATLVLGGRRTWAPSELLDRLTGFGVTVADLTPAYWHQFLRTAQRDLPRAGTGLRLLLVGGDTVHAEDCHASLRLLPGTRLVNAYGLTETVITSTLCEITADVLAPAPAPVPVGTALPGSAAYLLDEDLHQVPPGVRGEVYIGGAAVARGYWRRPELTAELFLPDPFTDTPGGRMYRTGDTGRLRPDGRLELFGRNDHQLKVLGFRVDPGEVESALGAHPAVGRAWVVPVVGPGGGQVLTAYFTLRSPARAADFQRGVRAYLAARLPEHMVPAAFVHVERLAANGGTAEIRPPTADQAPADGRPTVEAGLAHLWCELLGLDQVGPEDDFFALGGNSLIAMEMLARARIMFGIGVTRIRFLTRSLLHHPTLRAFAEVTRSARTGTPGEASPPVDFTAEAVLGVPVRSGGGPAPRWREPAEILLTGATGFCGAHLLRTLLETTGAEVHCLVRAPDEQRGLERILDAQRRFLRAGPEPGRIHPLVGDLAEPMLGLAPERFEALAGSLDVIHHCGGQVNFIYPYQDLRAVNVDGTREVLRLAGHARAVPVHYLSSLAVLAGFGPAGVAQVTEDMPLGHPELLSVGYVESKWVAEALLHNAAAAGLPVAVHRANDVTGDLATGAMNTGTEVCALIKFLADSGVCPDVELWLDFVPADRFTRAVAHIAGNIPAAGEVYHLTNPRHALLGELADRLRARGHRIEQLPYQAWVHRLVRFAAGHPTHPMTPFVPLFVDRCTGADLSIGEMYFRPTLPLFTRARAERALHGSGIEFPPVDAALLDLYLDGLQEVGFLDPAGAS